LRGPPPIARAGPKKLKFHFWTWQSHPSPESSNPYVKPEFEKGRGTVKRIIRYVGRLFPGGQSWVLGGASRRLFQLGPVVHLGGKVVPAGKFPTFPRSEKLSRGKVVPGRTKTQENFPATFPREQLSRGNNFPAQRNWPLNAAFRIQLGDFVCSLVSRPIKKTPRPGRSHKNGKSGTTERGEASTPW
jgi:hypothetical protein